MLASHNSYSYFNTKNIFVNLFSFLWKCQKLNIDEQYKLGVRIFDIRVYRYNNKWGVSHGYARFNDIYFNLLLSICEYFDKYYKGSIIRIYLEDNVKNNKYILNKFLIEADHVFNIYKPMIWEIGTHFPWNTYYVNDNLPFTEIKEYYCHLFNWDTDKGFWENIKQMYWSSWCLPLYAKKHNPCITQEMINDDTIHIMDYIGVYPKQKSEQ